MNPYTNRDPAQWLRVMRELELNEDFDEIFHDDKREELSHERIIEDFLDETYGGES